MIKIELSATFDNCHMTGKIKSELKEATFPQMCACVQSLTEAVIENFEISKEMQDLIGYFVASELLKKYKKNLGKEV